MAKATATMMAGEDAGVQHLRMVAVVGIGHMPGIVADWSNVQKEGGGNDILKLATRLDRSINILLYFTFSSLLSIISIESIINFTTQCTHVMF